MDYGESALYGSGELELDPDIVSEEAGKLYSELQVTNQQYPPFFTYRSNELLRPVHTKDDKYHDNDKGLKIVLIL